MVLNVSMRKLPMLAGVVILPLALSGCVGSSTYGTGKTSGEHLMAGLGGLVGSPEKKQAINYAPRPGLVKPPKNAGLPDPQDEGGSVYATNLPEGPELRRARLQAAAPKADERSGAIPIEAMKRRRDPNAKRVERAKYTRDETIEDYNWKEDTKRFRKQKAKLASVNGAAPRRYLTEPPRKYRTPADTAPIGEIGIDEEVKARKAKGKKRFNWRDLNPFG